MNALEAIGSGVIQGLTYVGGLTMQFWSGLRASPRVLPVLGKRTRWQTAMRQMAAIGVDALPIVAIMSVCAGFILAMQTGTYLKRYGALQYVMDVVAIGFTRELGPLLTALIVCGRSGSAFSAEIGTMVVTSEIDALHTMAIDPIELVLTPKYVAAMIVIPCLTIMSNTFGILAGAAFMYISTKIRLAMYLQYIFNSIEMRDIFTGLLKSLVFATIIVNVGCMEGFKVKGGSDAVGRSTTSAVVRSTYLVILADAFFTAIFYLVHK
ncbi:MAG: MlaE family ABC transporter permease [Candidatus Sulfotelmatobacter sp.]|jgi:phospholipid/cholesterol/gamma-HCH transport system permease protein